MRTEERLTSPTLRRRLATLGEGESDIRNFVHSFRKGVDSDDTWQSQVCHCEGKPVPNLCIARLIAQLIGQPEMVVSAVLDQITTSWAQLLHIDCAIGKVAASMEGLCQFCHYRKQCGFDVFDNILLLSRPRAWNAGWVAPDVLLG